MAESALKIYVSGRVQGVGFRYFTYRQAIKLQLFGCVRNLSDGRVEIIATGSSTNIERFVDWLKQGGPPSARIAQLAINHYSGEPYQSFKIEH